MPGLRERNFFPNLWLIASCWLVVSCSLGENQDDADVSSEVRTVIGDTNVSSEVGTVEAFVTGFSESDALNVILNENSDTLALYNAYISEDPILKFQHASTDITVNADATADAGKTDNVSESEEKSYNFSNAIFVQDLQGESVSINYCSDLDFKEKIPSIKEVVAKRQAAEQCGELSFFFCVDSGAPDDETDLTQSQYGLSPLFKISIPCKESAFANAVVGLANSNYLVTNDDSPNLGLKAGRYVHEHYLSESSDCSPAGEWKGNDFVHQNFNLVFPDALSPSNGIVYFKLKDVTGNTSECLSSEILVDKVGPQLGSFSLDSSHTFDKGKVSGFNWQEATDADSEVVAYQLGVSRESEDRITWIKTFTPGGLNSLSDVELTEQLQFGVAYRGVLRALDQAGNFSDSIFTDNTFRYHSRVLDIEMSREYTCAAILDARSKTEKIKCFGKKGALGLDLEAEVDGVPTVNWPLTEEDFYDNTYVKLDYRTDQTIEKLSLGVRNTCALFKDQDQNSIVRCWGSDMRFLGLGQTSSDASGLGNTGGAPINPNLNSGEDVAAVDIGGVDVESICNAEAAICILVNVPATDLEPARGEVRCWGQTIYLGIGEEGPEGPLIGDVPGEMGANIPSVKLVGDGESADVKKLECGRWHVCALGIYNGEQEVRCWGRNHYGQLGLAVGIADPDETLIGNETDEVVQGLSKVALPAGNIIQLASAWNANCVLMEVTEANTTKNEVYCWGNNEYAVLGRGDNTLAIGTVANGGDIDNPVPGSMEDIKAVKFPEGKVIAKLFAQNNTFSGMCGLTTEGDLYCWGYNAFDRFGLDPGRTAHDWKIGDGLINGVAADDLGNALMPTKFGDNFDIQKVTMNRSGLCALSTEGIVACFGGCFQSHLGLPCGNGLTTDPNIGEIQNGGDPAIFANAHLGPTPLILAL